MSSTLLTDTFDRHHNYLRISLTERCNLRCTYCMPEEGIKLRNKMEFMSQEELFSIAKTFVEHGVTKIRLTGGEPLIKKNFSGILNDLSSLPVKLALTTNAVLIDKYFDDLKRAGLNNINISIDSLSKEKFNRITRRKDFARIRKNIDATIDQGFNVKLNVVLMKGENDDEILDFIAMTENTKIDVRFIEFMPFQGNSWDWSRKVTYAEIIDEVNSKYGIENVQEIKSLPNDTSKNFNIKGFQGSFGIISTLTNPFCDSCNRIRLTADGKIKNCLFSSSETDILTALRQGKDIIPLIEQAIHSKRFKRAGINSFEDKEGKRLAGMNRTMTSIGG